MHLSISVGARMANEATGELKDSLGKSCPLESALNYLTAQMFLIHFRLDQKDRKTMMRDLYKKTLEQDIDLDGKSIHEGAQKVFYHNLSHSNRKSVDDEGGVGSVLQSHNSFRDKGFKEIFGWINVFPVLNYLYIEEGANGNDCGTVTSSPHTQYGNDINSFFRDMNNENSVYWKPIIGGAESLLKKLFRINKTFYVMEPPDTRPLYSMTLGFYKEPDKALYYGLYAELEYKKTHQLFGLPGRDVVFKGSAFAKAFGGRFGPPPWKRHTDPSL